MCAFWTTLSKSSLGAETIAFRLKGVVPAFHGHAHNRGCQVHWHPCMSKALVLKTSKKRVEQGTLWQIKQLGVSSNHY